MPRIRPTLVLCLLPLLTGCLVHTHRVKQAKLPTIVRDATADGLVQEVNRMNGGLQSLSAAVDFQASVGGASKGKVTDYTALSGFILLRKPDTVHVLGLVPVVRTRAFELASDGKTFELLIPSQNKVIEGTNAVTKPSAHPLENLRPGLFFDAMILRRIGPADLVTLTKATATHDTPGEQESLSVPEYALSVVRRKENSQELIPERVIHFSRVDLLPFRVESYDQAGAVETEADYAGWEDFGGVQYPKTITLKRPLEEYQIVITISKLTVNSELTDAQFEVKLPEGVQVQKLP
ncbi:MAG TPA: hypothetical protein VGD62_07385 [Acidobacteriaceae bacterium]